jgi:hypothetical protein
LVVVALAWSHAVWAEFYRNGDGAGLVSALEDGWQFFGGVPRVWIFETKTVLVSQVIELAQGRAASVRSYMDGDGVRWGEWALRRVPERLLHPDPLRDLERANRSLRRFVEEMLERRAPNQQGRHIGELLEDERSYLRSARRG